MIQVYTGNGKGKTTAALGLTLRGVGAGLKVYFAQFVKGKDCAEIKVLKKMKAVKLGRFGSHCFIKKCTKQDFVLAKQGLAAVEEALSSKKYDLVVLDEVIVALDLKLLKTSAVVRLMKNCPKDTELVLTGRNAQKEILKHADLISEIKEIRHYFHKGVKARKGIEC